MATDPVVWRIAFRHLVESLAGLANAMNALPQSIHNRHWIALRNAFDAHFDADSEMQEAQKKMTELLLHSPTGLPN